MGKPITLGRPPAKRDRVMRHLRRLIVSGEVAPGERLPTHKELERLFDAETPTIKAAVRALGEDGFIETRPRRGTFVAAHPPHLSFFALAFPSSIPPGESQFYAALGNEAAKFQSDDRRVSAFYGIESHVDEEDHQRLLGLVRAHRLAGLIFAAHPYMLIKAGSPLIREPGVLRTGIMTANARTPFPTVYPDIWAFLPKAFDSLAAGGRKRVAVVMLWGGQHAGLESVQALAADRGLTVRPHWLQAISTSSPEWARQSALLLLHAGQVERPDAVVITDDNIVEGFTAGIRDSGVRVAADGAGELEVVAQANFPYPTRSHVPAKRLGYNITQLMAVCLERIDQQRRGECPPSHTAIPAVWEDEARRLL